MSAPFHGPVLSTVSGTPGTGAITPLAAVAGYLAFSTVASNQLLLCRATDGTLWENFYSLWNGTTLSRVLVNSSSGGTVSLTSAAKVSIVPDPNRTQPHIGGGKWGMWVGTGNSSTGSTFGVPAFVGTGTAANGVFATTSYLARQHRVQWPSATTANAVSGINWTSAAVTRSATAFMGGFNFVTRFGAATTIPGLARLAVGVSAAVLPATATEPSALLNLAMFIKDSADANIQFATNDGTASATKIDTGIALVADSFYEAAVWNEPGEAKIYGLLTRLDTGAMFLTSTATDLPVADTAMYMQIMGGLLSTTGTAFNMNISNVYLRSSF